MTNPEEIKDFAMLVSHLVAEHGLPREWCQDCHADPFKRRAILDAAHVAQHEDYEAPIEGQPVADLWAYMGMAPA